MDQPSGRVHEPLVVKTSTVQTVPECVPGFSSAVPSETWSGSRDPLKILGHYIFGMDEPIVISDLVRT